MVGGWCNRTTWTRTSLQFHHFSLPSTKIQRVIPGLNGFLPSLGLTNLCEDPVNHKLACRWETKMRQRAVNWFRDVISIGFDFIPRCRDELLQPIIERYSDRWCRIFWSHCDEVGELKCTKKQGQTLQCSTAAKRLMVSPLFSPKIYQWGLRWAKMKNGGAAPVLLPNITPSIILLYNILVIRLAISS